MECERNETIEFIESVDDVVAVVAVVGVDGFEFWLERGVIGKVYVVDSLFAPI